MNFTLEWLAGTVGLAVSLTGLVMVLGAKLPEETGDPDLEPRTVGRGGDKYFIAGGALLVLGLGVIFAGRLAGSMWAN